jgi:hypothetical protein
MNDHIPFRSNTALLIGALVTTLALPSVGLTAPNRDNGPANGKPSHAKLDKRGKVIPPPRPAVSTVALPGEPKEQLTRNRHGWNEKKLKRMLVDRRDRDAKGHPKDSQKGAPPSLGQDKKGGGKGKGTAGK